jgi:hypothetical protein
MRPASFTTTVGSTGGGHDERDLVVVHEPDIGATLRTRGRLYLLCEIDPSSRPAHEIAEEAVEIVRHEYYYDLSAGVEVGLRRALRKANRRAAQRVREQRGRARLHLACAVVVNNELAAARIGSAQIFLIRRARLFLPGDEPDELADFVHRTTVRQAASLGVEMDLLPQVWRQQLEDGDTIVLAAGGAVDAFGAEALKNAAITLHPRAAADHIRARAVAEGVTGSSATIFIEIAAGPGAARREGAPEMPAHPPPEVAIADTIRSRVDPVWRLRPRPTRIAAAALGPVAQIAGRVIGVGLELMPRRRADLPRRTEPARHRSARVHHATSLLAAALLLVTLGVGYLVVRDYEANQVISNYRLAVIDVQQDLDAARSFATRKDEDHAWQKLTAASDRLATAQRSPAADRGQVTRLGEDVSALEDQLNDVIVDLAKVVPGAAPVDLTRTANGLYAADPGSGRLWRIYGDPVTTGVVLQRGKSGVGTPSLVTAQEAALLMLDDSRRLWRAEGNTVKQVTLPGTDTWKATTDLATFAGNVYVLDERSGQLWRYEPDFAGELQGPLGFLPAALPAGAARHVAIDGDIWILTATGELQRYRREGSAPALTKLPFTIQWTGTPITPTHIDIQGSIWLLDANAKILVQVTHDGREVARFHLPDRLPAAVALAVSEQQLRAYTVHGSKIAATDISR